MAATYGLALMHCNCAVVELLHCYTDPGHSCSKCHGV
jgi:hypothetical protein